MRPREAPQLVAELGLKTRFLTHPGAVTGKYLEAVVKSRVGRKTV